MTSQCVCGGADWWRAVYSDDARDYEARSGPDYHVSDIVVMRGDVQSLAYATDTRLVAVMVREVMP
jgi:hypothetical protein